MNLIEYNGVLKDIKQIIYEKACEYNREDFEKIDKSEISYYLPYAKSKHMDDVLMKYCSTELQGVRTYLDELWGNDDIKRTFIAPILAAYMKSKTEKENYLPEVDLHNYMM